MTYGKFLCYAQWNKSSLNVPILEHQRKGSDNGLSSRKTFLNIQSYADKLILLKKMKIVLNIPKMLLI